MAGEKTLATTLTAALAVQTVGALDPFAGKVVLPPPRVYLATWVLWFLLGLGAAFGDRPARLAGQFSIVVVLAMLVLGPFGGKLLGFLGSVTRYFAPANQPQGAHA